MGPIVVSNSSTWVKMGGISQTYCIGVFFVNYCTSELSQNSTDIEMFVAIYLKYKRILSQNQNDA